MNEIEKIKDMLHEDIRNFSIYTWNLSPHNFENANNQKFVESLRLLMELHIQPKLQALYAAGRTEAIKEVREKLEIALSSARALEQYPTNNPYIHLQDHIRSILNELGKS